MNVRLKMIKEQRIGVLVLLIIIFVVELIIHRELLFSSILESNDHVPFQFVEEIDYNVSKKKDNKYKIIEAFNPTDYTLVDWQNLGFSKKQAYTIINYKAKIGGKFTYKEQLKSCYGISDEMYAKIFPYLLLPEKKSDVEKIFAVKDKKYQLNPFDPNILEAKDWVKIGFSEKQAESIIKYRNAIGGKFKSKEDIKKCYVISSIKYHELEPLIKLPFHKVENRSNVKVIWGANVKKDINTAYFNDINTVIDNEIITKRILGFRKGLGGFVSMEQIKDVYDITSDIVSRIFESFVLDSTKIRKIDLQKSLEEDLYNHIYLRKYKNKIIEARNKGKDPLRVISESDPKYHFIIQYLN
ncbi:Helix-hairpin-helix motif-containing protein [Apibacter mensalis]|uniref:Helix-hairpin-helix motif-containing protein n=1 Tax=Apibacter mensalis TaxID=1586267 RepID=A0A0X3AR60_9FLAO|nr:helix-hairpin-helix domain-containing protein [Apibacter mensalis]CVK16891.1 Helix-hairpin-helix motif-containing protein [Apibacter mensalis]